MNLFAATLAAIRSALASILAKATGKPGMVDEISLSVDRDRLEAVSRFLGTAEAAIA